jgi:hypothetical protein
MSEREDVVETVDVETVAVTTPAPPTAKGTPREGTGQQPVANSQPPTADLGKVRDLVLKAHPDVVPDLVCGESVDELIASVEPARTAYQRIADQVRGGGETTVTAEPGSTVNASGETTVVVQPPVVPAGGGTNVVEPSDLGPTTKIAQALAARKTRG